MIAFCQKMVFSPEALRPPWQKADLDQPERSGVSAKDQRHPELPGAFAAQQDFCRGDKNNQGRFDQRYHQHLGAIVVCTKLHGDNVMT